MSNNGIQHILEQLMVEASTVKPNSEPVECWDERGARKPHSKNRNMDDDGYAPMTGRGKNQNKIVKMKG